MLHSFPSFIYTPHFHNFPSQPIYSFLICSASVQSNLFPFLAYRSPQLTLESSLPFRSVPKTAWVSQHLPILTLSPVIDLFIPSVVQLHLFGE